MFVSHSSHILSQILDELIVGCLGSPNGCGNDFDFSDGRRSQFEDHLDLKMDAGGPQLAPSSATSPNIGGSRASNDRPS